MPYWRLFYHITWGTKHRLPLIENSWEDDLYGYLWGKTDALGCIPHAIIGVVDHVHIVISIPPKFAVAEVIGKLKGASSHHVNQTILGEKNFYWQAEYGVMTFSERHLSTVVAYVQNQKKHHAEEWLWTILESRSIGAPSDKSPG